MTTKVIQLEKVCKSFGKSNILNELSLEISTGVIYGLLGENGAGKTTATRILLGLLTSQKGSSKVFGLDSWKDGWRIRQRVGYVADGQRLYPWMKIEEIIWFTSKFYPTWDNKYSKELLSRFDLDPKKKIRELSRGMASKLSLTLALAHRPELLVLDEATSGLDTVVRREFLDSVVELVEQEGRTVLISSHLLNDIERVVDQIGFLQQGMIQESYPMEDLKQSYRKMKISFEDPVSEPLKIEGKIKEESFGRDVVITIANFSPQIESSIKALHPKQWEFIDMSLEDIFVECLTKKGKEKANV